LWRNDDEQTRDFNRMMSRQQAAVSLEANSSDVLEEIQRKQFDEVTILNKP